MNKQFSCHRQESSLSGVGGPFMGSDSGRDIWWEEHRVVGNCQDGAAVTAGSRVGVQKGQGR